MDLLSVLPLVLQANTILTPVFSGGVTAGKLAAAAPRLAPLVEQFGAALIPSAAPKFKLIAAGVENFDADPVTWLQKALNAAMNAGLTVDGAWGPKTEAAAGQAVGVLVT